MRTAVEPEGHTSERVGTVPLCLLSLSKAKKKEGPGEPTDLANADVGETTAAAKRGAAVRHPRTPSFLSLQRVFGLDRHEHSRDRLDHDAIGAPRASFVEAIAVDEQQKANRLCLGNLPEPLAERHAVPAGQGRDDKVWLQARRNLDGRIQILCGHECVRAKRCERDRDAIAFFLGWGDQENQTSGQ